MKFQGLFLTVLFFVSSISFASENTNYSNQVGVQFIARSIVEKRLVKAEAREVILLALETGKAGFGNMECDRATGNDYCSFDVFIKDDKSTPDAEETLYRLDVRFIQGKLISAEWHMIAG